MKRVNDIKTTVYQTGHEDFMIDIIETAATTGEKILETWLYRENTGAKIFVIGEYKRDYPDTTIYQYARGMIDYIRTVNAKGRTYYDIYDEDIENMEIAAWEKIKKEKGL